MLKPLILLITITPTLVSQAADLNYPNRYGAMANSMLDMMDAFSEAYQKRTGDSDYNQPSTANQWAQTGIPWSQNALSWPQGNTPWSMGTLPWAAATPWSQGSMPWSQGRMPWSQGGMGPMSYGQQMMPSLGGAATPYFNRNPAGRTALDGSWQGRSGEVLVINRGHFRVYLNRNDFREGQLLLSGNDKLSMLDPATGLSRQYQYAQHQGKLVLRDEKGELLLYRRLE